MPKIAQYEHNQVQTRLASGPRASSISSLPSTNLQPIARGIADIGNVSIDIGNRIIDTKKRIDTTSAEEALIKFEKAKNNILFNPDNGYYNTQGRNAYDNASGTMEALEKLKNELGTDLNEDSRLMFNSVADKHLIRSNVDISRHSANGLKAWEVATIEAQVENTMENAALYWNNPQDLKVQRILGEQAIMDSSSMTGIGPEATNEKLQTYRSKFMVGAVSAATMQSSVEGQNLLDENEKMIEPQDKIKLQKMIDTRKKAEQTQADAGQATLTATRLVSDYDTRREIQDEVNKIEDPELRKKTMAESMTLYSQKRQAESEERGDIFEDVESHVMNGGTVEAYKMTKPGDWNKLSPDQQKKLTTDKAVETNWDTYSGLLTMPKEALAKVNPVDYFDQLAKAERKSLISAVKTAKGTGGESEKVDTQVGRTRAAQVKSAVIQIFGHVKKHKGAKLEKVNAFYSLLDSEVRYRENLKGAKLTSAEFTDVLSGFTREVVQKRSIFGQDFLFPDTKSDLADIENVDGLSDVLRSGGVPVTTESLVYLNDSLSSANITPEDALQISKFLKNSNIPVTAENIVKAYGQASRKVIAPAETETFIFPIPER